MSRTNKRLGVNPKPYTDRLALVAREYLEHEDEEVVIGTGTSHAFIETCLKHRAIRTVTWSTTDKIPPRRQITDKTCCSPSSFQRSVPQIQNPPPPPTLMKPWNNIVASTQPTALEPSSIVLSPAGADTQRPSDVIFVETRQTNVSLALNDVSPTVSTGSQLGQDIQNNKPLSIQDSNIDTTVFYGGRLPNDPFAVPYKWLVKAHFRADKPADCKWQITACIYLQDLEAQLQADVPKIDIRSPATKIMSRNPRDREIKLVCPWMHFHCAWTSGPQTLAREEGAPPRHLAWVCKVYFNGRNASFVDGADPMDLMSFNVLRSIKVFTVPALLPEPASVDEEQNLDCWMHPKFASMIPGCERVCRGGWAYSGGEYEFSDSTFRSQTAGGNDGLCKAEFRFETEV
ncbi:hypothetical protein GE09DRAFT_1231300 [Coniochaeta sp. 2T2.1]|nr:hypothetical protein GE09DRAFT_1231300 [Coniochaeta sp. 2T2.1]